MTTINAPIAVPVEKLALTRTNALHMDNLVSGYVGSGQAIADLGNKIGSEAVLRSGTFEDMMLQSLDKVSADQQFVEELVEAALTEPDSVDIHDLTIAQAKAAMSLNIARTILSRVVQGWRDIINTR